jgi:hypothetical protein
MSLLALALAASVATAPVQGRAVVECKVLPDGHLTQCRVITESPSNANVGAFALTLVKAYRIPAGDRRIVNGKIRIPLRFKMP